MKEIVNFNIGQAGVQLGSAMWELFCIEHAITETGQSSPLDKCNHEHMEAFFSRSPNDRLVPRGLFIDLEPTVVDEIKMGAYRDLFHPDRLIRGMEDAASNFARGFFTVGKVLLGHVTNENRKICEACEQLQAIMLYRSLGGGTGAGLTSALFDVLAEFPKTPKIDIAIIPSPALCTSTVEPYNALLAEHFSIEDTDISLLLDNEALYEICLKSLNQSYPTYSLINHLITQMISSVTASLRFENCLNCDVSVLQTNLVPFPRIHFPLCNYSPLANEARQSHELETIDYLTRSVFERDNQMAKVDLQMGRLMSCALIYRGAVSPYDVYNALGSVKRDRHLDFVEWCPTGFKIGLNSSIPMRVPSSFLAQTKRNVAMLTNSSAIGQLFQRISHKFYLLYAKRSFLHWFVGEGMEEIEFTESLFNITALVKDYEEVTKDSFEGEGMDRTDKSTSERFRASNKNDKNSLNI